MENNEIEAVAAAFEQNGIDEETLKASGLQDLTTILSLPDEQFNKLAPIALDELSKSLNNSNDKIILAQSLSLSGVKIEDLKSMYEKILQEIDSKIKGHISNNKIDFIKEYITIIMNMFDNTQYLNSRIIKVPVEICNEGAQLPQYANLGDAGLDVYALDTYEINPGDQVMIPTGIKVAIPIGYELQVRPRSGISSKTKLRIANAPGTIKAA